MSDPTTRRELGDVPPVQTEYEAWEASQSQNACTMTEEEQQKAQDDLLAFAEEVAPGHDMEDFH